MRPYNRKVWAYDPREMAAGWVGERVAVPDPVRVARNIVLGQDDVAWGPNNRFRFPRTDGTGHIWTALAARLPAEKMRRGCAAVAVDVARKRLHLADGTTREYAALISTIPLTELASMSDNEELMALAEPLQHSATHVIGVGLRGQPPADVRDKCWIYFPEEHAPFYRVTHFSHYSPHNVDDIRTRWSLLAEVSESAHKPVNPTTLANDVIRGLCATGMIDNRQQVTHTWTHRVEYGYPTPSLGRDAALQRLLPRLAACDILSRGRFGAWLYEVGNMDHSFMQGVEAVNHLLLGTPELTLWYPNQINTPHPVLQFERYREPVGDQVGRLAA
jgi:protoporphyrinogen oxidase